MAKRQLGGVQEIPRIARDGATVHRATCHVERIPDERIPGRGEMDADLMGSPRFGMGVAEEHDRGGFVPTCGGPSLFEDGDPGRRGLSDPGQGKIRRVYGAKKRMRHQADRRRYPELAAWRITRSKRAV